MTLCRQSLTWYKHVDKEVRGASGNNHLQLWQATYFLQTNLFLMNLNSVPSTIVQPAI